MTVHGSQDAAAGSSRFVGRHAEMALLDGALDGAVAGLTRVVTIAGEPGIGKTRTAREFARRARARGITLLTGCCCEGEGSPPLWPWIQVVRDWRADTRAGSLADFDPRQLAVVASAIPDAARGISNLPAVPELEPAAARFRLFDAMMQLLRHLCRDRPVLVLLEDLHWSDDASFALLEMLARQADVGPLLVLGTYRNALAGYGGTASKSVAGLERLPGVVRLRLEGMAEGECRDLIEAICGADLDDATAHTIWKESHGSPLFVQELVRSLRERGSTRVVGAGGDLRVPESVREVIALRLADLAMNTREVLRVASVIGRDFPLALLARVLEVPGAAVDRAALADAVDEAARAAMIDSARASTGRFSHSLVREVLYDEQRVSGRLRLHHRVGCAIEEIYAANLEPYLTDLARHFYEASLAGGAAKALKYSRLAGQRALRLAAFGEAFEHFQNAVQVLDLTDSPSARERCEVLVDLGEAAFLTGDAAAADVHLTNALTIARHIGDPELFGRAVFEMNGVWGTAGATNAEYVRLLEEALERLPDEDSLLRIRLGGRLATELYWTPQQERREGLGRGMLEMAQRLGTPEALAAAFNTAHWALWRPDNAVERLALADQNVALAEACADRQMIAGGQVWRTIDLVELGRMAEATAAIEAYDRIAQDVRNPHLLWQAGVLRAFRAMMEGRLEDSELEALTALQIGSGVQGANATMFFGVQIFQLRWHQGRIEELEDSARGFVTQFPGIPAWRAALAFICGEQGKAAEARRQLEILAADGFARVPRDANLIVTAALLSEVCAFLGDAANAATLRGIVAPYADHVVVVGNGAACYGAVAYFLARLAVATGDREGALAHLHSALTLHERMGARPHVAFTQFRLAELLAADHTDEAGALLRQVGRDAGEMGMQRLARLGDDLARRLAASAVSAPAETSVPPARDANDAAPSSRLFRRDGRMWLVGRLQAAVHLPNLTGFEYVAYLLRHPDEPVSATALLQLGAAGPGGDEANAILDAEVRADYKRQIEDLGAELEEARRFNDSGRAERLQEQLEVLAEEMVGVSGIGERARPDARAERARVNVTRAIAKALGAIEKHEASLARHLRAAIRTGRLCTYASDPEHPIRWEL